LRGDVEPQKEMIGFFNETCILPILIFTPDILQHRDRELEEPDDSIGSNPVLW
jgi:hypothetical protein